MKKTRTKGRKRQELKVPAKNEEYTQHVAQMTPKKIIEDLFKKPPNKS